MITQPTHVMEKHISGRSHAVIAKGDALASPTFLGLLTYARTVWPRTTNFDTITALGQYPVSENTVSSGTLNPNIPYHTFWFVSTASIPRRQATASQKIRESPIPTPKRELRPNLILWHVRGGSVFLGITHVPTQGAGPTVSKSLGIACLRPTVFTQSDQIWCD